MTKQIRDTIRPAYMRNFTKNTIERFILILADDTCTQKEKDALVKQINEKLWKAIQEVNAISKEYNLPYVIVRRVEIEDDKLRVIIPLTEQEYNIEERALENESHLITLKKMSPARIIQLGDRKLPGSAEIIADSESQITAIVDIFLDIAMFNSISYLRDLDIAERQEFNKIKFEYFMNRKLKSYFYINKDNLPTYISFAFSQHENYRDFDYYGYVLCWDDFLKKYYPNKKHIPTSALEQLKKHADYDNLPQIYKTENFWQDKSGAFLLLRTNKHPNDLRREYYLTQFLGESPYHIGITKLVNLDTYFLPFLQNDFRELNISAFKIVV